MNRFGRGADPPAAWSRPWWAGTSGDDGFLRHETARCRKVIAQANIKPE